MGRRKLRLADDVSYESLGEGEETVILSFSTGYLYTCNETAAAFLDALDGQRTVDEVVDLLEAQFDAPRERIQADAVELANELISENLVVERRE